MANKILVAMDDSENAMRAVNQVANLFQPNGGITLFSVLPDTEALCDMNSPELTSYFRSQQSNFCALEDKKKELVRNAMNQARDQLVSAGFDKEKIEIKTQVKKEGVARDIVKEARGGYDLVVLGRRGLTGFKEFFLGSISHKVLNLAKDISVLIVN